MSRPRVLEIPQLTGIRAVAAGWVVLFHADRILRHLEPELGRLGPLLRPGYLGVDLFFVLSGFIIAHNYLDRFETPSWAASLDFLKARLARLYPVHLATLLVILAGVLGAGLVGRSYGDPSQHRPEQLVLHLLLLHDWVWASSPSWNLPSWSISAEWFAYLAFIGLAPVVARVRSVLGALLLALGCYAALSWLLGGAQAGSFDVTTRGGLIRVFFEFTAGCLLERAHRHSTLSTRAWGIVTWGSLTGVVALTLAAAGDGWIAALLGLFVLGLARSQGALARLLSSPAAVYGGKISYALYMTHGIVLHLFESFARPERLAQASVAARWSAILVLFGALWLAADLTYRLVEEPGRRWVRRLSFGFRRLA